MFRIKNLRVVLHVFFFYWKDKGIPPFKCRVLADLVRNNPFGIWNNWNRIQLVHLFVYFLGGYWKFLRLQEEYITRPSDSWYILLIVEEISNSLLESKQTRDLIVKSITGLSTLVSLTLLIHLGHIQYTPELIFSLHNTVKNRFSS